METETPKKKRRWPWMVAGLFLLLAVAPAAWQRYRPLTDIEQRLVGDWLEVSDGEDLEAIHFRPDRTWYQTGFMANPKRPGFRVQVRSQQPKVTWSGSGTTLTRTYDRPWDTDDLESFLFSLAVRICGGDARPSQFTLSGPDRLTIDEKTYERFDEKSPEVWRTRSPASEPAPPSSSSAAAEAVPAPAADSPR